MMKRYTLTLGLAMCAWLAQAQIAVEKFNYAPGTALVGAGAAGDGWAGPWAKLSTAPAEYTIAAGSLQSALAQRQTSGNHVTIDKPAGADVRFVRPLSAAVPDVAGTRVYMSSFQRHTGGGGSYTLFASSTAFGAGGPGGQFSMTGQNPGTAAFGHSRPPATNVNSTSAAESASFIVTGIFFRGAGENEHIFVWVNPSPTGEPDTAMADLKIRNLALDNGFDAVGMKATGGEVMSMIDEVRVGTTYADVVAGDLQPFTPTNPSTAFALEQFDYAVGSDLLGNDGGQGWNGPWTLVSDSARAVVEARGLANDELNALTDDPSVLMTTNGQAGRLQRLFAEPLRPADGDFWFSVHLAVDGNLNAVATLNLIDTTQASQRDRQALFVGKQFGNRNVFAAGFGGTGEAPTGETFEGNSAEWIVSRAIRNVDSSRWELYVWVNPDPTATTLDTMDADIKGKRYRTQDFHGVWLKAEANLGLRASFDDIFVGRSYADVIPDDFTTIPAAATGAEEPFDYTVGAAIQGLDGGDGWGGPWQVLSPTPGLAEVAAGGVTSFGVLKATEGPHGAFNNVRATRPLSMEFGDFGRTYWVGWWTISEGDLAGNVANLVLASDAYGAGGPAGQLVQIGKGFGLDNISFAGGPAVPGALASEGQFLVAEIVTNGSSAPDQIYLWANPRLDTRPSRDSATVHSANLAGWSAIGVKAEGNAGVTARFDNIFVGRSYADVVPDDLTDVDAPGVPVAAVEVFDYPAGTALDGQSGGEGWGGPWTAATTATIAEGSLTSPRVNPAGNRLTLTATDVVNTARRPTFAAFGQQAGEVWASFQVQMPVKRLGTGGAVNFMSGDTTILSIGASPGSSSYTFPYRGGPTTPVTVGSVSITDLHWVVARFRFSGDAAADSVRVWVDPPADALPTDESAVFSTAMLAANSGFNGISVSAGGTVGDATINVDDIRLGFGYRDISNRFGSDDPDLIAYEPFNYDPGTALAGRGGVNAFWDGPWRRSPSAGTAPENTATIIAGNVPDAPQPEGNRVEYQLNNGATPQRLRIERRLGTPFSLDDGPFWMSFAMNTTKPDGFRNVAQVMLLASGSFGGNDNQVFGAGRTFDAASGPIGFSFASAGKNDAEGLVDDLGSRLLVVQVIPDPTNAGGDIFALWVDPPLGTTAPDTATAAVVARRTRARGVLFDGVMVKVEGADAVDPYATEFDEIRLGRTFAAVVGMTVGVEEATGGERISMQAFPNPATHELTIAWESAQVGEARIDILDQLGRVVATPYVGVSTEGEQRITWSVEPSIASGIYYIRVVQGGSVSARQLVISR